MMEGDHWPHGACDGDGGSLARLRRRASECIDSLSTAELADEARRHLWVSDWVRIAEDYRGLADAARRDGSVTIAREACLCASTSLEVARSLARQAEPAIGELVQRSGLVQKGFDDDFGDAIERVTIDGPDGRSLRGLFLPALRPEPAAPAVICLCDEESLVGAMMSRMIPVSRRRNIALLFVDAGGASLGRGVKPEQMLQGWVDHLEARPDVDRRRIAIYGEGLGASHASRLAVRDRRVAAAVCDGGALTSAVGRASVRWLTGLDPVVAGQGQEQGQAQDQTQGQTDALLPSRRIACPLLLVAGSRSLLGEQDTLELQAAYRQAGIDCSVVVPNRIQHPLGEVENFIAVDDFVFEWLGSRLGAARKLDPVVYL